MARSAKSGSRSRQSEQESYAVLWLIAAFKLVKGLLLLAVAIGALTLLGDDVSKKVAYWIALLGVDPNNRHIHRLLVKLTRVDNSKLEQISAGTFFYSALLLTEGIGLFLRKRWAEYLTIFITGSLIPLEIYELAQEFSKTKVVVLVINVAVVVYLVIRLRRRRVRKGFASKVTSSSSGKYFGSYWFV
jgi:uncharacterized membrane protein (DUF2068 family)